MLPFQALVFDKSGIVYRILKIFACASLSITRPVKKLVKPYFIWRRICHLIRKSRGFILLRLIRLNKKQKALS